MWGIALVLLAIIVASLTGSYRVFRSLEGAQQRKLAAVQSDHQAELASLRERHQAEVTGILASAVGRLAGGIDPEDWRAYVDHAPDDRCSLCDTD